MHKKIESRRNTSRSKHGRLILHTIDPIQIIPLLTVTARQWAFHLTNTLRGRHIYAQLCIHVPFPRGRISLLSANMTHAFYINKATLSTQCTLTNWYCYHHNQYCCKLLKPSEVWPCLWCCWCRAVAELTFRLLSYTWHERGTTINRERTRKVTFGLGLFWKKWMKLLMQWTVPYLLSLYISFSI